MTTTIEAATRRSVPSALDLMLLSLHSRLPSPAAVFWRACQSSPFAIRTRDDLFQELEVLPHLLAAFADELADGGFRTTSSSWQKYRAAPVAQSLALLFVVPEAAQHRGALSRMLATTGVAVAETLHRAARSRDAEVILWDVRKTIEERLDPATLADLARPTVAPSDSIGAAGRLEPDRLAELSSWRQGGLAGWMALAALVASELELGPRHFAALEARDGNGRRRTVSGAIRPADTTVADRLLVRSEAARPIWRQASGVVAEWARSSSDEPRADLDVMSDSDPPEEPEFLSAKDMAMVLGINQKTLYSALERHPNVPGVARVGARYVVDKALFLRLVRQGQVCLD